MKGLVTKRCIRSEVICFIPLFAIYLHILFWKAPKRAKEEKGTEYRESFFRLSEVGRNRTHIQKATKAMEITFWT